VIHAFPEPGGKILPDAKFVADSDLLDLEAGAHDLVVHAMCLHGANDPVGQMVQGARRWRRRPGRWLKIA